MKRLKFVALIAAVTSALFLGGPASAQVWNEINAGETLTTAEGMTGNSALTGIHGMLNSTLLVDSTPLYQVDLYRIYIDDFAHFSARTTSSNPDDTALFLFDSTGKGVYTNDDNASDLLSTLPVGGPQADSFYYLAVSLGGFTAFDAMANNIFMTGSFTDVLGANPAAGTLASWGQGFTSLTESSLAYDVALTGARTAPIPEPSTVLLLALGLGGLVARRFARRAPVL